jgi:hypothetical protein
MWKMFSHHGTQKKKKLSLSLAVLFKLPYAIRNLTFFRSWVPLSESRHHMTATFATFSAYFVHFSLSDALRNVSLTQPTRYLERISQKSPSREGNE